MKKLLCFIAVLAWLPSAALANDTISSVTQDGIRFEKTDSIRMKKEVLSITPRRINVDYVFENESDVAQEVEVAFPMPSIGVNMYDNRNTLDDFTITADGKKVSYEIRNRAELDEDYINEEHVKVPADKDITKQLKQLSLPLDRFIDAKNLTKEQLEAVKKNNYYTDFNADSELNPAYSLQRTYYWKQVFPPHQPVRISHSYSPQLGMNSSYQVNQTEKWKKIAPVFAETFDFREKEKERCPKAFKKHFKEAMAESLKKAGYTFKTIGYDDKYIEEECARAAYSASYLEYILSTGANWKNGIEDFTLNVEGRAVILVEIEGEAKGGYNKLTLHKKNFKPTKELTVEFIGGKLDRPTVIKIIDSALIK